MNTYEPTREDLADYVACREARDREAVMQTNMEQDRGNATAQIYLAGMVEAHKTKMQESEILVDDKVTMKVRIPGFCDDEVCRVVAISKTVSLLLPVPNVSIESLDGERYGWTSISNLTLYHG